MNGFTLNKGDSKFFFVLTLINAAVFTVWNVAYVFCTMLRSSAFNTAQTNMLLTGQTEYTVEVTSPAFGFLKAVVFVLPVLLAVWTVLMFALDRKNKKLCSNFLIIGTFAADAFAAILCALDIVTLNMIF